MRSSEQEEDAHEPSMTGNSPAIIAATKLSAASDVSEAVHSAAALYLKKGSDVPSARTMVREVVRAQRYDHFEAVLVLARVHESAFLHDGEMMMMAGFAAWVCGSNGECERWSKRLIALHPQIFNGYLRLGMNYLSMKMPVDAFLAFSAGLRNAQDSERPIMFWWKLAEHLTRGNDETVFEKWGHSFRFRLSCFSTQAVEADAVHVSGSFTEEPELAFLSSALQGCEHFLEVGTLVGNHSVCLATMVKPKTMSIVDANERSVEETRHNLSLNRASYPETKISFRYAALAGPETKSVTIEGVDVSTVTLDALLSPEIDFLKIDVDGMEAQLLEPLCRLMPGRDLRLMIEVEAPLRAQFVDGLKEVGFVVAKEFPHETYTNLFFVPA